jgi:hypothetical protein
MIEDKLSCVLIVRHEIQSVNVNPVWSVILGEKSSRELEVGYRFLKGCWEVRESRVCLRVLDGYICVSMNEKNQLYGAKSLFHSIT